MPRKSGKLIGADLQRRREIPGLQVALGVSVCALNTLVIGPDFVIELLIRGAALLGLGLGKSPVQIQNPLQLAQRRADIAALLGCNGGLIQLFLLLTGARMV